MLRQNQSYQVTPGALTATGTNGPFNLPYTDWNSIVVGLSVASVSGTTPTLDMYLQTLGPDGNYYDVYHWTQLTANTTANTQYFAQIGVDGESRAIANVGSKTVGANALGIPPLSNTFRLAYTIGGTTPSFTPTINFYFNNEDHGGL